MTYVNWGWMSLIILGILVFPYILKRLNKYRKSIDKSKNNCYIKTIKFFRKIHKPLGLSLIIIPLIHGYMALGALRLHTGLILYLSALTTALLGGAFYKTKNKNFFTWHKRMAVITILFFLIHFFAPNAIYYLLN
ncbi:hypothetical protein [Tissierella creatinophila]|uniref:Uncharacterized protein n=1 Tax=Tissierella creatinophila DSM 6911 TaxID=1123403 RepID=A0A1U7M9E1_TISCR|nr:hypothetical protein [Tissierella creatinophila]OLS03829.1 hypothetical protein TICRE_01520 [Tissierella creatinophila DSM 6911]